MPEEARIGWSLKVDGEVKLNLMQDRSCVSSLLKAKDSNLNSIEWTSSVNIE